ncbi:MAG: class I SAM-dependent methyltransferase [Methylophilus sp.]|nr:class I SAM-dependent methyltransferase [Methylophilus sp.]
MSVIKIILWLLLALSSSSTYADKSPANLYQQFPPTAEGTGKVYMGREIAHVMGYQGAAWLERENRENEERTDLLIQSLNLKAGMTIADIGAGTGYLSRKIASRVTNTGTVYAVDVQPEMIGKLKAASRQFTNIKPVLSKVDDIQLPANSVDLAIMVDVYHELAYPYEVIQSILKALKPNGQLVLVEYRAEDDNVPIKATHKMTEAQIKAEMRVHPLTWQKTINTLPWQHVVIFTKQ